MRDVAGQAQAHQQQQNGNPAVHSASLVRDSIPPLGVGARGIFAGSQCAIDNVPVTGYIDGMKNEANAITDEQVEALRIEAGVAGDAAQVDLCERALAGDESARDACADAIADAQAQ